MEATIYITITKAGAGHHSFRPDTQVFNFNYNPKTTPYFNEGNGKYIAEVIIPRTSGAIKCQGFIFDFVNVSKV